jgi:hypothetical protein
MNPAIASAQPAIARLVRTRRVAMWCGLWVAVALAAALHARHLRLVHGADGALIGVFGAWVLPILCLVLVRAATGPASLTVSARQIVMFGAVPWKAAAATALVAVAVCAGCGAVLGTSIAVVAHGSGDPPVVRDALASAYAGLLGATAYSALLLAGARPGRRGYGAVVVLIIDLVFGSGSGTWSMFTPRAHLRNLLGGEAPVGISGTASALAIVAIAGVALAFAVARRRP